MDKFGSEGGVVDPLFIQFKGGDESLVRKESGFLRFVVLARGEVGAAGQGIGLDHLGTGEVNQFVVELG
jgi:hypothetical protein